MVSKIWYERKDWLDRYTPCPIYDGCLRCVWGYDGRCNAICKFADLVHLLDIVRYDE